MSLTKKKSTFGKTNSHRPMFVCSTKMSLYHVFVLNEIALIKRGNIYVYCICILFNDTFIEIDLCRILSTPTISNIMMYTIYQYFEECQIKMHKN